MIRALLSVSLAMFGLLSCTGEPPDELPDEPDELQPVSVAPVPAPATLSSEDTLALGRANVLVDGASSRLQSRMVQEMNRHAPSEAVESCSIEAEALTTQGVRPSPDPAALPGERVGRSSLKLRNPDNGAPAWVVEWLAAMGDRPYQGVDGISRIAEVEGVRFAQVLRPIPVEERCLVCHGGAERVPADVRAILSEKYPHDRATGYAAGDLRGAMWAEVPVVR